MTRRLEYVRLLVEDLQRSIAFYRDVLGLTLAFDDGDNYASFDIVPGFSLSLFRRELMADAIGVSPAQVPAGDRVALVIAVPDVDAEAARLRDLGDVAVVATVTDRPDWGIRTIHLRDPDGNLIELNDPLQS